MAEKYFNLTQEQGMPCAVHFLYNETSGDELTCNIVSLCELDPGIYYLSMWGDYVDPEIFEDPVRVSDFIDNSDDKGFSVGSFDSVKSVYDYLMEEGDDSIVEILEKFCLLLGKTLPASPMDGKTSFCRDFAHFMMVDDSSEFLGAFGDPDDTETIDKLMKDFERDPEWPIIYLRDEVLDRDSEYYDECTLETARELLGRYEYLFCDSVKSDNPYTVAYKLAYDAYAWSYFEMWDILDECLIKRMITISEAETIAEDVAEAYNR